MTIDGQRVSEPDTGSSEEGDIRKGRHGSIAARTSDSSNLLQPR